LNTLPALRVLAALVASGLLAGCPGIPNDDRYQIHDGGRSNTRAQAPAEQPEKSRALAPLLAVLAGLLVSGCPGIPNDGRYQTHGGGWDNFRAEALVIRSS
jgi:hypothetical protein